VQRLLVTTFYLLDLRGVLGTVETDLDHSESDVFCHWSPKVGPKNPESMVVACFFEFMYHL